MTRSSVDWIYGRHTVVAVLADDAAGVREVWLEAGADGDVVRQVEAAARDAGIAVQRVSKKALEKHLGDVVHQGVAVRYRPSRIRAVPDLDSIVENAGDDLLLLLLDEITDPHNVGACLRTAEAAGVNAVVVGVARPA